MNQIDYKKKHGIAPLSWIIFIHLQLKSRYKRVWFVLVQLIPDFVSQKLNNKISSSYDIPVLEESTCSESKLVRTSLLYDSEIHSLISQRELDLVLVWQLKKIKVILNQKLYNLYLFKYNS